MSTIRRNRVSVVLTATALLLSADAVDAFSSTYSTCTSFSVGDGFCDSFNNNADCDYDGGDCCECTCVGAESVCNALAACIDPFASCVSSSYGTDSSYVSTGGGDGGYSSENTDYCTGDVTFIADGECDPRNNNVPCGYDGGDCCDCTCVDADYACGVSGFYCVDPSASCQDETTTSGSDEGSPSSSGSPCASGSFGDGSCDSFLNTAECNYDSGDCCECTCLGTTANTCGNFDCQDPDAPCDDSDEATVAAPSTSGAGNNVPILAFAVSVLVGSGMAVTTTA